MYKTNIQTLNLFKNLDVINNVDICDILENKNTRLIEECVYFKTHFDNATVNELLDQMVLVECNKIVFNNKNIDIVLEWSDFMNRTKYLSDVFKYYVNKMSSDKTSFLHLKKVNIFYKEYVKCFDEQNMLININKHDIEYIIDLLNMINQFIMLRISLNDETIFPNSKKDLFVNSIVDFEIKYTKYLHKMILKNKNEITVELLNVIKHVKNIANNKIDLFVDEYEKLLVNRLIKNVRCYTREKKIIVKIGLTHSSYLMKKKLKKLDKYFVDVSASSQIVNKHNRENYGGPNIYPIILKMNAWPKMKIKSSHVDLNFIFKFDSIAKYIKSFNDTYKTRHPKRELMWDFNKGTAKMNFDGLDKKYTLIVTTIQMFVLFAIEKQNNSTFQDLIIETGMRKSKLSELLSVLCTSGIINIIDDKYNINGQYTNKNDIVYLLKSTLNTNTKISVKDKKNEIINVIKNLLETENSIHENKLLQLIQPNVKFDIEYEFMNSIIMQMLSKKIIVRSGANYTLSDSKHKFKMVLNQLNISFKIDTTDNQQINTTDNQQINTTDNQQIDTTDNQQINTTDNQQIDSDDQPIDTIDDQQIDSDDQPIDTIDDQQIDSDDQPIDTIDDQQIDSDDQPIDTIDDQQIDATDDQQIDITDNQQIDITDNQQINTTENDTN
jgi:hypothetical protein